MGEVGMSSNNFHDSYSTMMSITHQEQQQQQEEEEEQYQNIRVLRVTDTIVTLTRLYERLEATKKQHDKKKNNKKKKKNLKSLCITFALVDHHDSSTNVNNIVDEFTKLFQLIVQCFPKLKSIEVCSETMDIDGDGDDDDDDDNDMVTGLTAASAAPAGTPSTSTSTTFRIPIQILTVLLHPNKGLKKLTELTLDGLFIDVIDDTHMNMLSKAIVRHKSLQCCYLYETTMTLLEKTGRSGMEKFVTVLSKKLHKLVIVDCRLAAAACCCYQESHTRTQSHQSQQLQLQPWAGTCLIKICQSTTLQELKLHNLQELREEHIVMMSQALRNNKTLRKLSILKSQELPQLSTEDSSIALLLSSESFKNKPKHLLLPKYVDNKNATTTALGEETATSLSSDASTLALANMLRTNTTLQELCLNAIDFNEYSALFFGNALEEDNYTLKDMWVLIPAHNGGTSSFPVDDKRIDYYLRLNRSGRKKFIKRQKNKDNNNSNSKNGFNVVTDEKEEKKSGIVHMRDNSMNTLDTFETFMTNYTNDDFAVVGNNSNNKKVDKKKAMIKSLVNSKRDVDCSFFKLQRRPSLCEDLFVLFDNEKNDDDIADQVAEETQDQEVDVSSPFTLGRV